MEKNRCNSRIALHQCLAITIRKEGCQGDPGDFWMYENGYLLFQGLLSANTLCWWNTSLNGVTKGLEYRGYISPGAILVCSEPCSLDILRNAWARRVLQAPQGYQIVSVEEIEGCYVKPVTQTQWTPLPEAVCAVVLKLSSQGKPAGIQTIREALYLAFPHVAPPSEQALYDTLAQLSSDRKLYHTTNGYFIVTPERRRSRSLSRGGKKRTTEESPVGKTILMSTEEAMVMVHGDMSTLRDGDITHQCIQTNLADVISGGNASDKILYARPRRQWNANSTTRSNTEQRSSFKLFSSNRRIRRSASTRTLAKHYLDTSSSTDGPQSDTSPTPKKGSFLSRIFRKSKRSQCQIQTQQDNQYPPSEWFNSKAVRLSNVGTQTTTSGMESILPYDTYDTSLPRSATLPRRHRRHLSGDLTFASSYSPSRENSPIAKNSTPISTMGKSSNSKGKTSKSRDSSRKTSRTSLHKSLLVDDNKLKVEVIDQTKTKSHDSLPLCPSDISEIRKNLSQVDNSGPSSIESHKSSSRTGSSITSGPSSLESHKTVIRKGDSLKNGIKIRPRSQLPTNFTVEVSTNREGTNVTTNCTTKTNSKTTTKVNAGSASGSNTRVYVQNTPNVRSVIKFENGRGKGDKKPNLVIINGNEETNDFEDNHTMNQSKEMLDPFEISNKETNLEEENLEMNNIRKLSLNLPTKDSLNYHNLIKNISQKLLESNSSLNSLKDFSKNCINSDPPSPTKNPLSSSGNLFIDSDFLNYSTEKVDKNLLGSEPNIYFKESNHNKERTLTKNDTFPSLNDLTFNFTSLAAQKILKGVSINSVDTLVELQMAAAAAEKNNGVVENKQKNYDVVHTDFGML